MCWSICFKVDSYSSTFSSSADMSPRNRQSSPAPVLAPPTGHSPTQFVPGGQQPLVPWRAAASPEDLAVVEVSTPPVMATASPTPLTKVRRVRSHRHCGREEHKQTVRQQAGDDPPRVTRRLGRWKPYPTPPPHLPLAPSQNTDCVPRVQKML